MKAKISNGKPTNPGYYDYYTGRHTGRSYRKCHFCRKVIRSGEEYLTTGGSYGAASMHRVCLVNWLDEHPPAKEAVPAKVVSNEEAEKEFEKIRKKLMREVKAKVA